MVGICNMVPDQFLIYAGNGLNWRWDQRHDLIDEVAAPIEDGTS